ncbi:MAG: hypothetical protein UW94_C0001G0085 [Parcubacteria group bacterium GW2011_GWA2_45_14]|nr:MAG: hypothetical protein UW94_C0001G0085 [Parcubacteria group bacterium GW2011_GWA2_45_14]
MAGEASLMETCCRSILACGWAMRPSQVWLRGCFSLDWKVIGRVLVPWANKRPSTTRAVFSAANILTPGSTVTVTKGLMRVVLTKRYGLWLAVRVMFSRITEGKKMPVVKRGV